MKRRHLERLWIVLSIIMIAGMIMFTIGPALGFLI